MKTILMATDVPFWRQNRGGLVRIATLYRFLTEHGFQVPISFLKSLAAEDYLDLREAFGDVMILPPATESLAVRWRKWSKNKLRWYVSRLYHQVAGRPVPHHPEPGLGDYYSKIQQHRFRQLCSRIQPDFVLVEFIRHAYLVEGLEPYLPDHARTLIDTHDVMHLRCQRFHELGERHWINITEEEEGLALTRFDAILAIQNRDALIFRDMVPGKQVIHVGHACDAVRTPPGNSSQVTLAFIGSNGPHNRRAVQGFLDAVWPKLLARYSGSIGMRVIGSVCRILDQASLPPGVVLEGFVEQLDSVYQDIDILVNPVVMGGGLKIKNVEALSHGKPLVTTKIGAEGLEDGSGHAFFVCDDEQATYKILSHLIESSQMRQQVGQRAFLYARKKFAPANAYRELLDFLLEKSGQSLRKGSTTEIKAVSVPVPRD